MPWFWYDKHMSECLLYHCKATMLSCGEKVIPQLCDQAVSINRSNMTYTPQCKLSTAYFHMLFLKNTCTAFCRGPLSFLLSDINRGRLIKSHLCLNMSWKLSASPLWEGEVGFNLHLLNYIVYHYSTEELIIPHKEWMRILYACRNVFSSNAYFMTLAKRSLLD